MYLDRITGIAGKNMSLKRDVAETDNRFGEEEAKILAAAARSMCTAAVVPRTAISVSVSDTIFELLRTRVVSADGTTVWIGQHRETYCMRASTYSARAINTSGLMH